MEIEDNTAQHTIYMGISAELFHFIIIKVPALLKQISDVYCSNGLQVLN